jgi:flagellar motor protein MotB
MRFRGNHRDRWMISYADFVTILFAAFVLLFASALSKERIAVHALV